MASEIRVNSLSSRTGLSTVTFTDTGPIFSGITTFQDNSGFNVGTGGSIFSPASNTVTLGTNNTERLRITSAGNIIPGTNNATSIGDGTTNFASIWASTRFRGNDNVKLILGNSQDLVIRHDGTNNIIGSPVGGDLHIKSGTGDNDNQLIAAFKHSNASVGIGTDNPDATLKVNVASGNNGVVVQNTSTANIALFGARNGDATVQIGQWGSTASGSTFGLSNADLSFIYTTSYSTTHPSALALGTVSNKPIVFATNNTERLRIDPSGHLLHGVTADEDTSGNGGVRFINSGDIQIDGDQKALVFRSTNNTAQLQSAIEWWNENGAGVQSKIACDRTAVSQGTSDLVFYTSANVDTAANSGDGDITERLRITSSGIINSNNYSFNSQGTNTASDVYLGAFAPGSSAYAIATNGAERLRITSAGKLGIGIQSPFSRFQSGGHTFSGGNGMHSNDRVGMSNHGQLTGLMLASTYNDGAHPEYGLVFVQGPNTSSYNVWSLSPDGPAKGNSLNFHYDDQASNIHAPGYRKFQMTGEGYFLQPHQPAFRAGRSSTYNPGAGSDILFDSTSGAGRFNQGGHYNTSNGRFTAPVSGRYMFTAHVIWQNLGNGQNMADCWTIQLNNNVVGYSGRRGEYIDNETGNSGYYTDWNTFVLQMSANDYVTITNARSMNVHGNPAYTTFAGYLIG